MLLLSRNSPVTAATEVRALNRKRPRAVTPEIPLPSAKRQTSAVRTTAEILCTMYISLVRGWVAKKVTM